MRVSRDNGTMLRFHKLLKHYEPLSNDANLRRLIRHLYADEYFHERLVDRGLGLNESELFDRMRERTYGSLIDAVFGSIAAGHGRASWGYKRASLASMTGDKVNEIFPHAKFVHIIRDAREVVLSMQHASLAILERSYHFAAKDWVAHVTRGLRVAEQIPRERLHEIRYEQFMEAPADVMIGILDFLGGGPDRDERAARIRAEIGSLVKSNNTAKWRQHMSDDSVKEIERVAGPLLAKLGYPVMFPEVSGKPIGKARLAYLHWDRLVKNITHAPLGGVIRYRVQVAKAWSRARRDKT